ncbi:IclR family transcriptional regulator [Streptomyces xiaopingdaonensis]|uniref:IclR family transcriptional regulator n=1 Tax=Streptomyces xiaopingdaonensis TaxID=1565415 RepID=UPI00030B155E|nr:helix-turn-helix domain-containing protein [Streptomyces xiaopingdaonensis]
MWWEERGEGTAAAGAARELSSLDRGLLVLAFIQDRGQVDVAEIVAHLGLPSSSAYRYVRKLKRAGYVVEVGSRLLPSTRLADRATNDSIHLVDHARPVLGHLRAATGLTAAVSVRVHTAALCPDSRRSGPGSVAFLPGEVHTLYSGASATPLLAMAPRAVQQQVLQEPLHRYTTAAPGLGELRRELAVILRQGYHFSRGWLTPGMSAVGVPLVVGGRCLCALSLVGADHLLADVTEPVRLLQEAADMLAERLQQELPTAWTPPDRDDAATEQVGTLENPADPLKRGRSHYEKETPESP